MSEWKKYKLGEIASVQTGPFGSQLHQSDYVEKGTPIITVEHLGENRILHENLPRITDEDKKRLNKYWLKEGDIVFSRVGSVDRRAYVKKTEDGWLFSGRCLRVRPKNVNGKYLSYFFGLDDFKKRIRAVAVGATMPSLNTSIMNNIEVQLPENISTQTAIAQILTSLDDKIELNLQMNQTLEAMAQAIFKEWFFNFNFPGFDGELVDGLPKGWKMGKLNDISLNFDSKRIPLSSRERAEKKGIFPYYGAASILDYVEDYIFDGTYLLMGEDGTVVTLEGFPVLQYVWGKFWVNNHTHVLQGKAPFTTEYLFLLLSKTQITHIITGAVQPKINQGNMNKIECVIPTNEILEDFQKIILPLFEKRKTILDENKTLTQLRDTLLPKLMSGQLEVGV